MNCLLCTTYYYYYDYYYYYFTTTATITTTDYYIILLLLLLLLLLHHMNCLARDGELVLPSDHVAGQRVMVLAAIIAMLYYDNLY